MAFLKQGAGGPFPVDIRDPRSILVKAGATATRLQLASTQNPVEFDIEVAPTTSFYITKSGGLHDRFPVGDNLVATITGDANSFVRIDG